MGWPAIRCASASWLHQRRAKLLLLEAELLTRAIRPLHSRAEVAFAIECLTRAPQVYSMAMLSEHVGLSARRFTRLFTLEVGRTPKLLR